MPDSDSLGGPPELGASDGDVRIHPRQQLAPGALVTVDIETDGGREQMGGIYFKTFRWEDGWSQHCDWLIDARSDGRALCSTPNLGMHAVGVILPTTFTFTLPELEPGTHRLTYRWNLGPDATYTFVVP